MNIMLINPKGGVARSCSALQFVAPYFLSRDKKVKIFDINADSKDSSGYSNTIIDSKYVDLSTEPMEAVEQLKRDIEVVDNCVLDVGGNGSTLTFLKYAYELDLLRDIDHVMIPVASEGDYILEMGPQVRSVELTFELIDELFKGLKAKVCFCLTRVRKNFDDGDVEYYFPGILEIAKSKGLNKFLYFQESNAVVKSREFGVTAWEISNYHYDLIEDLLDELDKLQEVRSEEGSGMDGGVKSEVLKLSRKISLFSSSRSFSDAIESEFEKMDEILGIEKA